MAIVNITQMLNRALKNHYAILHANVINYDMAKTVMLTAQENKSPIIVAISEKALKGFANAHDFVQLIHHIVKQYRITVPIAIHLDHGEYKTVLAAIEAGFTSVMYDGSKLPLQINLRNTRKIVTLAHAKKISVECEVGTVPGKLEDNGVQGQLASLEECKLMAETGIDALAAGIGNLHGNYPHDWQGLDLTRLKEIHQTLPNIPLVLHGGSGIPDKQIKKAIQLGVCKFNVGTELLTAFSNALAYYFIEGGYKSKHGYDPRNYIPQGLSKTKDVITKKLKFLGSYNKAK
ncbi:MAG: class II fructose-bisphosphate aldolase [Mycoplasmataceae bacterium]|jgi:fructose-bisphosphate aldolase class II|nr:class II fructose-bisphosphate aldolase [Mycoplasmataceae bacterium]